MNDMVTCKYCGIVPRGHICPYRRSRQKSGDRQIDRFRKTKQWTEKSIEIRQRDRYLCRVCEANLYHTVNQLNWKNLEVHHIVPLCEDYNKRLDNDNLITLCKYHHTMADSGEIPREELFKLVSNPPHP